MIYNSVLETNTLDLLICDNKNTIIAIYVLS